VVSYEDSEAVILYVKLLLPQTFQAVVLFLFSFHPAIIEVSVKRDMSPHRNREGVLAAV
jgi:hypothetical protein